MQDTRFIEQKEGLREAICVRCGGAAVWRFLDDDESRAEVSCVDCGLFEMSRVQLDEVETDLSGLEEPGL
jgi:uncharacterized cysteine cluster protein YcgN (CxxCxxCC family)